MSFDQPNLFGDVPKVSASATAKTAQSVPARLPKPSSKSKPSCNPAQSPSLFPSPSVAPLSTQWGNCRVCGSPIAIPGNDADLCSNPERTCGSNGWVDNPQWGTVYYAAGRQRWGEK